LFMKAEMSQALNPVPARSDTSEIVLSSRVVPMKPLTPPK